MTTITLSRIERDGLHWNIGMVLDGDDLPETPSKENQSDVKERIKDMQVCCAILDEIGWDEHGGEETYTLSVDRQRAATVGRMMSGASEYADDELYWLEHAVGDEIPGREKNLSDARAALAGLLRIVAAASGVPEPELVA